MTTSGNGVAPLLENKNAVIYGAGGPTGSRIAKTFAQGIRVRHHSGINAFIEVTSRAPFAAPSRAQRAYPHRQERTQT
jgi:hypothetical protein